VHTWPSATSATQGTPTARPRKPRSGVDAASRPTVRGMRLPPLPLDSWRDTCATLHRWLQIVGKVQLALTPRTNHFWNAALQITPRGLTTPAMAAGDRTLALEADFVEHLL